MGIYQFPSRDGSPQFERLVNIKFRRECVMRPHRHGEEQANTRSHKR
jgi:hypothetical protein